MAEETTETTYALGDSFTGMYPADAAEWVNANGYMIKEMDKDADGNRVFQICECDAPSATFELERELAAINSWFAENQAIVIMLGSGIATESEYPEEYALMNQYKTRIAEIKEALASETEE